MDSRWNNGELNPHSAPCAADDFDGSSSATVDSGGPIVLTRVGPIPLTLVGAIALAVGSRGAIRGYTSLPWSSGRREGTWSGDC